MASCSSCGEALSADARFCERCGAPAPRPHACSACGAAMKPEARFCTVCGAPADRPSRPSPVASPQRGPALPRGALDRAQLGRAAVIGCITAVVTIIVSAAVLLLAGLVHSDAVQVIAGTRFWHEERLGVAGRVARALFAPWTGSGVWHDTASSSNGSFLGLTLTATIVLVLVLAGCGYVVRRVLDKNLLQRCISLVAAALTVASVLTITAAAYHYTVRLVYAEGGSGSMRYGFSPGVVFISSLVVMVVIGSFAFGVVGLLPRMAHGALKRAALLVGVIFVFSAAAWSIFVITDHRVAYPLYDAAVASTYSPAVASAVLPSAFGAPLHLTADATSAMLNGHYRALNEYVSSHHKGYFWNYAEGAGLPGGWAALSGLVFVLAMLASVLLAALRHCRSTRAATLLSGATSGAAQGASIALLSVPLVLLSRYSDSWIGGESSGHGWMGISTSWLFLSVVIVIAACAAVGVLSGYRRSLVQAGRAPVPVAAR